jgi:FemAB-related protein (PEP-CTERM system-associated)
MSVAEKNTPSMLDKLIITTYEPQDRDAWDTFVWSRADGTVYHTRAWQDIVNATNGYPAWHLCAKDPAGNIHGVLSLVRLKSRLFGDFMLSLPYVNYCGILASSPEADSQLMQRACEIGAELGVSHIEFRDRHPRDASWPVRTDKVVMVLDLAPTSEEQLARLKSSVRARIRRAQRENVEVRFGREEMVPAFYRVFSENMRDLGTPVYSKRFFVEMSARLGELGQIGIVFLDGQPVAGGLLFHHGDTTEIPSSSSLRRFNPLSVNSLLYWECIKFAIERGSKYSDFRRCTLGSNTHRFKKKWGTKVNQLHWHYWLRDDQALPQLNPDNESYALAIRAWQKLPVWAANILGPHIVRYLP